MRIHVGHSADPDDAFMVWALGAGKVDTRGLELEPVASDIQTLNEWALEGRLEVTALSAGAYPAVADRYLLLPHGASFGDGYGPIVVAREELTLDELREIEIATPGPLTTATRVLRLALGDGIRDARRCPSTACSTRSSSGRARAGLLIHEGQLTYARRRASASCSTSASGGATRPGCRCRSGSWPCAATSSDRDDVSAVLREAIDVGLANREEALAYAREFGRGIDAATADEFVAMYVNDLTLDMGERGRAAVARLLGREPELVGA